MKVLLFSALYRRLAAFLCCTWWWAFALQAGGFNHPVIIPSCPNAPTGKIILDLPEIPDVSEYWQITWEDANGNTVGNSGNLLGVSAGTYTYHILNTKSGCTGNFTFTVPQAEDCLFPIYDVQCEEEDGGEFTGKANVLITLNGGLAPFTVESIFYMGEVNGNIFSVEINDSDPGPFDFYITDAAGNTSVVTISDFTCTKGGCEEDITLSSGGTAATGMQIIFSGPHIMNLQAAQCNGTASVTHIGGVGPFQYDWYSAGAIIASGVGLSSIDDLCAGAYTVTITDMACNAEYIVHIFVPDSNFPDLSNTEPGRIERPKWCCKVSTGGKANFWYGKVEGEGLIQPIDTVFQQQWIAEDSCISVDLSDKPFGLYVFVLEARGNIQAAAMYGGVACQNTRYISQTLSQHSKIYAADNFIEADNLITDSSDVVYQAGDYVLLKPGFQAQSGNRFTAYIKDCPTLAKNNAAAFADDILVPSKKRLPLFQYSPNPANDKCVLIYQTTTAFNEVSIRLYDSSGKIIFSKQHTHDEASTYQQELSLQTLISGTYWLQVQIGEQQEAQPLIILP